MSAETGTFVVVRRAIVQNFRRRFEFQNFRESYRPAGTRVRRRTELSNRNLAQKNLGMVVKFLFA